MLYNAKVTVTARDNNDAQLSHTCEGIESKLFIDDLFYTTDGSEVVGFIDLKRMILIAIREQFKRHGAVRPTSITISFPAQDLEMFAQMGMRDAATIPTGGKVNTSGVGRNDT